MRQWALKLDEYGISKSEYEELKAFCRRYDEKRAEAADMLYRTTGKLTGMPRGSNTSDPVCAAAVQRDRLLRDCEMIEQAAIAASGDLYAYILRNVTRDEGITALKPPCGRRQFYEARRKFFFLLRNAKLGHFGAVER